MKKELIDGIFGFKIVLPCACVGIWVLNLINSALGVVDINIALTRQLAYFLPKILDLFLGEKQSFLLGDCY